MDKSYIPSQIKSQFIIEKEFGDEPHNIEGHFICLCKNTSFNIKVFGKIKKTLLGSYFLQQKNTSYGEGVEIRAFCSNCGRETCIFNSLVNGYDAVISNVYIDSNHLNNQLELFNCLRCKKDKFRVMIEQMTYKHVKLSVVQQILSGAKYFINCIYNLNLLGII